MDLGFKSNPNMHRGPKWPIQSADRSRANVGGAGRFFWERLRDANQFMFCGLQYRSLRRLGGDLLLVQQKLKNQTHPLRNEAQLNCVALRVPLDYEVAWRALKGQDERPTTAPLTALHAIGHSIVDVGEKKIWRAATSALTFMTFS